MEDRGKMIEKILKLRAHWHSDMIINNEHEGLLMKAKADALMEEYGISASDLTAAGDFTWSVPKEPEAPSTPYRPRTWNERMWDDMQAKEDRENREANKIFECAFTIPPLKTKSIYDSIVTIINDLAGRYKVKVIKLVCDEVRSGPFGLDVSYNVSGLFTGTKDSLIHVSTVIQYALVYMQQQANNNKF